MVLSVEPEATKPNSLILKVKKLIDKKLMNNKKLQTVC